HFGFSVALSAPGDTIAIGAIDEASGNAADPADNSAPFSGAAYVFARSGSTWSQRSYIKASNIGSADVFGAPVAMSATGDTIVIAAEGESSDNAADPSNNSADHSGAAYVFTFANVPCARDDTFLFPYAPPGIPFTILTSALLANDAHSQGLPFQYAGQDAFTE